MASLHESTNLYPSPPSLIIIDRLDGYLCGPGGGDTCGFHSGEQSLAAHLSALLCDSASFLTQLLKQRSSSTGPCRFIASFQSGDESEKTDEETSASDPILQVLDRYFQVRCTLDRNGSYEAAAAGLQEIWHIYFSGTQIPQDFLSKDSEDRSSRDREWQLLVFPDGLMEFKLV